MSTNRIVTSRRNCIGGFASGVSSSSSESSWRRIAASSSFSSGPGSRPSSSTRVSRAVSVGRERVGLAPRAIEGEHELPAWPLAQGLRLDERLELGDELGVAREREVGVDPLLERDRAQLLEPCDLGLCERLVEEVGQGGAAPQAERLAESGLRCLGAAVLKRVSTLVGEADEAVRVDPVRVELEHVARRACGDDRPERLAELRHVDLDGVRGGLGRLSRPEALDEAVDGDDATDVEREDGEQCARLWPAEPDGTTARRRL